MASPKLTSEQRATLLEWLAADYDWRLIKQWFEEREWPAIGRSTIYHYRKSNQIKVEALRDDRRTKALRDGLALKAERIARLVKHADALEAIKWVPDEHGRLWNEKAWRETLDQIAIETGQKVQRQDVHMVGDKELDDAIERELARVAQTSKTENAGTLTNNVGDAVAQTADPVPGTTGDHSES